MKYPCRSPAQAIGIVTKSGKRCCWTSKTDKGKNIQAKKIVNNILSNLSLKSIKIANEVEIKNPVSSIMYIQLIGVLHRKHDPFSMIKLKMGSLCISRSWCSQFGQVENIGFKMGFLRSTLINSVDIKLPKNGALTTSNNKKFSLLVIIYFSTFNLFW